MVMVMAMVIVLAMVIMVTERFTTYCLCIGVLSEGSHRFKCLRGIGDIDEVMEKK